MSGYVIKRDGEIVGYTDDRALAEFIDDAEVSNQATDPAYSETYRYTTASTDESDGGDR